MYPAFVVRIVRVPNFVSASFKCSWRAYWRKCTVGFIHCNASYNNNSFRHLVNRLALPYHQGSSAYGLASTIGECPG